MTRAYTLPPDQIARAFEAGGPLVDLQVDPARLAEMQVAVVEVDDQIVGYWVVWHALHVEPLWIREAHRKSPSVVAGLLNEMQTLVEASGEPAAFAVIEQDNLDAIEPYATRLGFIPAPGHLYYLVVPSKD